MTPDQKREVVAGLRDKTSRAYRVMAADKACPTSVLDAFATLATRISDIEVEVFGYIGDPTAGILSKVDTQGR